MASKRRSVSEENAQDALATIDRLTDEEKSAVLRELVENSSVDVTNLLVKKRKLLDGTPVSDTLLNDFGLRASQALHQLDDLRPVQQCEMSGQVSLSLSELVKDTRCYPALVRLACLARVAEEYSYAPESTGEVFKSISHGFGYDLCESMKRALRDLTGGVAKKAMGQLRLAKQQVERVDKHLSGYGINEFKEVFDEINSKMALTSADDKDIKKSDENG